jgi:competence protein ComEC
MENRLGNLESGSLLNALVLGNPLPLRIQEQAIKTGILHVFAISGLQTTLLMG